LELGRKILIDLGELVRCLRLRWISEQAFERGGVEPCQVEIEVRRLQFTIQSQGDRLRTIRGPDPYAQPIRGHVRLGDFGNGAASRGDEPHLESAGWRFPCTRLERRVES
jgi:hypothetical protein